MRQASWRVVRLLVAFAAVFAAILAGGAASARHERYAGEPRADGARVARRDRWCGHDRASRASPSAVTYANARELGASKADAGSAGKASKNGQRSGAGSSARRDRAARGSTRRRSTRCRAPTTASRSRPRPAQRPSSRRCPGVEAVHAIPLVALDNHSSVPLIGALQAWGSYGKTGTGMRIAVIDTGVDYVHRGFGGSGSSADYRRRDQRSDEPAAGDRQPGRVHDPGHLPDGEGRRRLRLRR